MYNRSDPRFRRTLNQISHNLESANESAQVGLFSFSEFYLKPCFAGVSDCVRACAAPCLPATDERTRTRRRRGLSRGRPELNFDFYDDWEEDENDALLAMGNDELDRLLGGGPDDAARQPAVRQATMSYGSQGEARGRAKGAVLPYDGGPDPTVIPSQSVFGFLAKLPFGIGTKDLRYKPSAADLKERKPRGKGKGAASRHDVLLEDDEDVETAGRHRSGTTSSQRSHDSYSSRGDIFPSDEEDAVALEDDEFAFIIERRSTGQDDRNSSKTKASKRPINSGTSTRTHSSRSTRTRKSLVRQGSKASDPSSAQSTDADMVEVPTLAILRQEELMVQEEEKGIVEQKRTAARKLARQRGLGAPEPTVSQPPQNSERQDDEDSGLSPFPALVEPTQAGREPATVLQTIESPPFVADRGDIDGG